MAILPSAFDLPAGRLLALDLGQVRCGVAVCDEAGLLASPLIVVPRQPTREADFARFAALAAQQRAVGVRVGMPIADDPRQARWVRRYAGRLAGALAIPLAFWDESLSSLDAQSLLSASRGRTGLDAAAAAVFLEDFLAARRQRS
jgi:putative Holliday junction resolvase